ncbi:hypothetical protein [Thermococcus zilligii]|uniref:hypothetical protein n=1 Tax=Thermococcus zilligii TaxID=54076 RepID=UPI00029B5004|nr:hypothetical protein [Thermococcus zilligii]
MGEIVINVPNGLEKVIWRKIAILLEKEGKKGVKRQILEKYLGKFQGTIDEEEWYFQ